LDLAVTRISGRRAPPYPGTAPNLGKWVMREAYSHEVSSCGFWPGNGGYGRDAFSCYAYPKPATLHETGASPYDAFLVFLRQIKTIAWLIIINCRWCAHLDLRGPGSRAFVVTLGTQMKTQALVSNAIRLCDEVIDDCKKLRSKELRQFFEEYANAQKEVLEALRNKLN
jgi:hypothetical protein